MNVFAPFRGNATLERILWVNHGEKIKTLFEAMLIHTDITRMELQNKFNDSFFAREKKIFIHVSRNILRLTFEEISSLVNVSKTSAHNLFTSNLSSKDTDLIDKIEFTYSNLLTH